MSKIFDSYMEKANMKKFEIFAGLGGGFGGLKSYGVYEFNNQQEAEDYAYELACNEYERYSNRFPSVEKIMEDNEINEEEATQVWLDTRDSWVTYKVKEIE